MAKNNEKNSDKKNQEKFSLPAKKTSGGRHVRSSKKNSKSSSFNFFDALKHLGEKFFSKQPAKSRKNERESGKNSEINDDSGIQKVTAPPPLPLELKKELPVATSKLVDNAALNGKGEAEKEISPEAALPIPTPVEVPTRQQKGKSLRQAQTYICNRREETATSGIPNDFATFDDLQNAAKNAAWPKIVLEPVMEKSGAETINAPMLESPPIETAEAEKINPSLEECWGTDAALKEIPAQNTPVLPLNRYKGGKTAVEKLREKEAANGGTVKAWSWKMSPAAASIPLEKEIATDEAENIIEKKTSVKEQEKAKEAEREAISRLDDAAIGIDDNISQEIGSPGELVSVVEDKKAFLAEAEDIRENKDTFHEGISSDVKPETTASDDDFPREISPFDSIVLPKEAVKEEPSIAKIPDEKTLPQNPSEEKPDYILPKVDEILAAPRKPCQADLQREIAEKKEILAQTLENFRVNATISDACHGPAVTRFEVEPAPGVKVSKITNLADDLALALAAVSVRIEPIPGKAAIGIEVPNAELEGVGLREVLDRPEFAAAASKLTFGIGMDISGEAVFADIQKMPHLLVAGATGSGKSVCINTLITSILFKARPDEVKLILIDPKMVELSNYNGIPHLMEPVVTDVKKATAALNWAVQEMEERYAKFAANGVRDLERYNRSAVKRGEAALPSIIIIIDELADLMMVAPRDVEDSICRIAQKARAAGIHLVLATQRPSVDVITGIIKANIPSRISFAVSSQVDSRTILDTGGAEKLLGKGDMLFAPLGLAKPRRVQGAFVSDDEVERLLAFIRDQGYEPEANEKLASFLNNTDLADESKKNENPKPERDALLEKAVRLVIDNKQASTSFVQRRLRIGYSRSARLLDEMEDLGIIGPIVTGKKSRDILVTLDEALELLD